MSEPLKEYVEKYTALLKADAEALLKDGVTFAEVLSLIRTVSTAVAEGLEVIPGADKRVLVKTVVRTLAFLFAKTNPILAVILSDIVLDAAIEWVYQAVVKPRANIDPLVIVPGVTNPFPATHTANKDNTRWVPVGSADALTE